MILSRTPFRISFFGGGTDYLEWYTKEGGAVLSTSIDKYCYISCRVLPPFFGIKHRIVWRHVETVESISSILHPAVREGLQYLGFNDDIGLEIHYQGDLPARSGLGTSSSFAVGLIKALLALKGQIIGKQELALKAIELEKNVLKENVGAQDQIAAAYGGLNHIQFNKDGSFQVQPVTISSERLNALQSSLMLFYIGGNRSSSGQAKKIIENMDNRKKELQTMHSMVAEALSILNNPKSDLNEFGRMLNETWQLKRTLSMDMSNKYIDRQYENALKNGALGGKLLGAGGAGFMLLFVPKEKQSQVLNTLENCIKVDFLFENEGCTIIHYDKSDEGHFDQHTSKDNQPLNFSIIN